MTDRATGDIERTRIDIDPALTTLQDFADSLNAVDRVSATVDPSGRLRINAESGYGFDFATRLDTAPDAFGTFGGTAPTLGTSGFGPFDLSGATFPLTFDVDVNGTSETVTINATDVPNTRSVSAEQLADAINDDLSVATARSVGNKLLIRSDSAGGSATLTLTDGANGPLAALGIPTGPVSGQDNGVSVAVSGEYTGTDNGQFVFVPDGDGEIGVTPGLTVGVFNGDGVRVGTLDVGAGYVGDQLSVADGVQVSFSQGFVSASSNQAFALDTLTDSDTSDVLVALGLNSFFTGNTAETLGVNPDLEGDPTLFAAGLSDAAADAETSSGSATCANRASALWRDRRSRASTSTSSASSVSTSRPPRTRSRVRKGCSDSSSRNASRSPASTSTRNSSTCSATSRRSRPRRGSSTPCSNSAPH